MFTIEFRARYAFTATGSSLHSWTLYLNGGRTVVGARPIVGDGLARRQEPFDIERNFFNNPLAEVL